MTHCKNCNHVFKGDYNEDDIVYCEITDMFNDTISVTTQEDDPHIYVTIFGMDGEEKVVALPIKDVNSLISSLEEAVEDAEGE